ncbi:mercury resistance system transport protein MerF [Nodosilinea sp. LEGE 06152]|uniref:mercury resistance system transport protein MerF n=1 Tax=Nodosilinea sp. LEGE 06152 TaxID=2777966 RepID=UPI001880AD8F|nr:mercury resistance system transport protein MerF [Nodosilinea sp. LEGE 06152]MBE9156449.1 mercury resistance system transport protein MerF [Nodosilinea sp. LEGE 06152]
MTPRNTFIASLVGTAMVALCWFTPVLVIVLSALSLAAGVVYLNFGLLPLLAISIALTAIK